MNRKEYYDGLCMRARQVRATYGLTSARVMLRDLRRIYRNLGITVDYRPLKGLRGAYFRDEHGASVLIAKNLPDEPKIFTLGHELKHHLVDGTSAECGVGESSDVVEIGAEIFAAELIFPENDFLAACETVGLTRDPGTLELLVRLKRETQTTLSYAGLAKRAIRAGLLPPEAAKTHWKKLEERLYGEPRYKQILRWRTNRAAGTPRG